MSTLNGQEIAIFRAGPHGNEKKRVFSAAEVAQIARDYDPSTHEAPIVVGHPELNSPAFGWFKALRADGDVLYGTPHEVMPEFDSAVEAKHYKKRSAAFDPLPGGKWRLRHVGFLGGTPPAIKGLADVKFASGQYEEFEYSEGDEMAGEQQMDKSTFMGWLREAFADFGGGKKGEPASGDLLAMEQRLSAAFAEQLKAVTDAHATTKQQFSDFQAKHVKGEQSALATAAVADLKRQNKWLPAFDRMGLAELFAAVAEGNTESFEFADSGTTKKKLSPLEALTAVVGGIAKFVPRGQTFGDEQAAAAAEVKTQVPEVVGADVDKGSAAFDVEIKARMQKDNIGYPEALRRLTAEGKSNASYASASAGEV